MKRNRKKITFIAALCLLAALASACQKQPEGEDLVESSEEQSEELSQEAIFQDQYDLGMRLLSEGNYEEAIIAFSAALEINPKSVNVYTALADTYKAMGDEEAMRRILKQGIEATGDAGLEERLANIQALEERLSRFLPLVSEGRAGFHEDLYVEADGTLESLLAGMTEAGLAGNSDILTDDSWNTQLTQDIIAYLEEKESRGGQDVRHVDGDGNGYAFWTVLSDGALVRCRYVLLPDDRNERICIFEYRPVSGTGFMWNLNDWREEGAGFPVRWRLILGQAENWLFNGGFTIDYYEQENVTMMPEGRNTEREIYINATGTAENDWLEGEGVEREHWVFLDGGEQVPDTVMYSVYKAGVMQIIGTDENGNDCTTRVEYGDQEPYYSPRARTPLRIRDFVGSFDEL